MAQNNKLIEKLDSIDYTHLLGYPSEVVAAEVITLVKEVVSDHMDKIVEQLEEKADEANDDWTAYGREDDCFDGKEDGIREAIEIVKGGAV